MTCNWCHNQKRAADPTSHRLCWVGQQAMRPVYLFLSAPYASDPTANVRTAIAAAERLIAAGYHVYVPHLMHLWDLVSPNPTSYWLMIDVAWVRRCDAVVRLPGRSPGAEVEAAAAVGAGIPIATMEEALA